MAKIATITQATHKGKEGFNIEWEMNGFSEQGAKFRARATTAFKFPTTVTEAEVVGVREFDERDYNVIVFVPTEGFLSAGIRDPVKFIEDSFNRDVL